jgi:malate synthase
VITDPAFQLFIEQEVLPHTQIEPTQFWLGFAKLIAEFAPRSAQLLSVRARLQAQISQWHIDRRGLSIDPNEYLKFLRCIGYIQQIANDFSISTTNVDPEIATIPGPQLVVPLKNTRFALNAANARWGSLYDALYGSDIIDRDPNTLQSKGYDRARGDKVILWVREFLDLHFPLEGGSHRDATAYQVVDASAQITLSSGQ